MRLLLMLEQLQEKLKILTNLMLEKFKSLLSWNKEQKLQVKESKQQLPKEQKKPSKKGEKKNEKRKRGRPRKVS